MPVFAAIKQWWSALIFMQRFGNISFYNEINRSIDDII